MADSQSPLALDEKDDMQETINSLRSYNLFTAKADVFHALKASIPAVVRSASGDPIDGFVFVGSIEESKQIACQTWEERLENAKADSRALYVPFIIKLETTFAQPSNPNGSFPAYSPLTTTPLTDFQRQCCQLAIVITPRPQRTLVALVPLLVFDNAEKDQQPAHPASGYIPDNPSFDGHVLPNDFRDLPEIAHEISTAVNHDNHVFRLPGPGMRLSGFHLFAPSCFGGPYTDSGLGEAPSSRAKQVRKRKETSPLPSMINAQCASKRQGYLRPIAKPFPFGTHMYLECSWSEQDVEVYEKLGYPPFSPGSAALSSQTTVILCRVVDVLPVAGPLVPGVRVQTHVYAQDLYFESARPIVFIFGCRRASNTKALVVPSVFLDLLAIQREIQIGQQAASKRYIDLASVMTVDPAKCLGDVSGLAMYVRSILTETGKEELFGDWNGDTA